MREIFVTFLVAVLSIDFNFNCAEYKIRNYFFDTTAMMNVSCGSGKVTNSDCSGCICASGYVKSVSTRDSPVFDCVLCTSGVPSSDQYRCQDCPGAINSGVHECTCNWGNYEVILEKDISGNYLDTKQCQACSSLSLYPGDYSYSCQACPDRLMSRYSNGTCFCVAGYNLQANKCIPAGTEASTTSSTMYYDFLETGQGASSSSISSYANSYYYIRAYSECYNEKVVKGCQVIANLCTLALYSETKTDICSTYKDKTSKVSNYANDSIPDKGWKEKMTWLYYSESLQQVWERNSIKDQVTFDPSDSAKMNLMQFKLAEFALDGTLLSFQDLTDQLILCPHSLEDSKNYREFGTNINIACSLDVSVFFSKPTTTFFELYYIDLSGNIYDVPILVTNYKDSTGNTPNSENADSSKWQLTRRFFLYDNISGYLNAGTPPARLETTPFIIQYLAKAKLRFTLRSDTEERIYLPYLILTYSGRYRDEIARGFKTANIVFVSEYGMDTSKFWQIAQGIFIGMNILVLICWVGRLYVWTKINPQKDSPTTWTRWFFLTAIRMLITTWGFLMFWYLFGLTGYWFIFYKLQYFVYALVPPLTTFSQNYYPFEVVLGLTIACCLFNAFYQVYHQADLDLLIIDWEKPNRDPLADNKRELALMEKQNLHPQDIDNQLHHREEKVYKEYVSAWRYLFIVNELNELQCQRYVSIEFSLFLFVFFLDGLGWDEMSRSQPNSEVGNLENNTSPRNPVLRYFLTCSLLLVIMYSQFIVKKVLSIWIATPVQNFIDLCSICNISVMVLDEFLHGYYIHGVSPNGSAETGIDELLENLNKEASGKSRARGIMPEDTTGLQSFEIFIPTAIRKTYNFLAKQPVEADIIAHKQGSREASGLPSFPDALPNNMNIEKAQEIRQELNRRLKIYIAGLVRDAKTQILDKSAWQRFLRMPPVDLSTLDGTPYFYRDPAIGFEASFLMGREFSFILMDIMLFELFDYTIQITYVAILLTYVVSKIVVKVRSYAGEWNLSRKTLVNKRFLL